MNNPLLFSDSKLPSWSRPGVQRSTSHTHPGKDQNRTRYIFHAVGGTHSLQARAGSVREILVISSWSTGRPCYFLVKQRETLLFHEEAKGGLVMSWWSKGWLCYFMVKQREALLFHGEAKGGLVMSWWSKERLCYFTVKQRETLLFHGEANRDLVDFSRCCWWFSNAVALSHTGFLLLWMRLYFSLYCDSHLSVSISTTDS